MRAMTILAALLLTSACAPSDPATGSSSGPLAQYAGRWVVLNYWAEWCAPCRQEIPELNELDAEQADVVVVGVNFDGISGQALGELAGKMGIQFSLTEHDPAKELGLEPPEVLPTTMIFDPEGHLRARLVGPQTRASIESVISGRV